jgi:CpXC protein
MSKFEIHRVACPDCGHAQQVDIYVSINAERMSEATDLLIDGSWERFTCECCGHPYVIDNRLLYTDLPRKRWIVRYPFAERARYHTLEDEAARVFDTEYLQRPPQPIRRQAAEVSPRICFGRRQLAEKLLAWRHDLDDRALECLKLVLLRIHTDALLPLGPSAMQLAAVANDTLVFDVVALGDNRPLEGLAVPVDGYRTVAGGLSRYRQAFPALFDRAYVDARRYLE